MHAQKHTLARAHTHTLYVCLCVHAGNVFQNTNTTLPPITSHALTRTLHTASRQHLEATGRSPGGEITRPSPHLTLHLVQYTSGSPTVAEANG